MMEEVPHYTLVVHVLIIVLLLLIIAKLFRPGRGGYVRPATAAAPAPVAAASS
jgi:hypothetical protein